MLVLLFIFDKAVKDHAETHEIPYSTCSGEGISWSLPTNTTVIMFFYSTEVSYFSGHCFASNKFLAFTGPAVHCD